MKYEGRRTKFAGRVVHGRGIGTNLGYPTANILPEEAAVLDPGVYAVILQYDRQQYHGVLVVGAIPDVLPPSLEVHIFDFSGDLYRQELSVEVIEQVSELERFDAEEELLVKIESDIAKVRECFARQNPMLSS